ncbi:MAG: phospholipase D-like domain-containing protein [Pseudomonadota bacterium]
MARSAEPPLSTGHAAEPRGGESRSASDRARAVTEPPPLSERTLGRTRGADADDAPVLVRTRHHEVVLYPEPMPLFEALERAIGRARERVWLETYIYRDDAMGAAFAALLARAAARGVDVRLLYDPQGSRGTSRAFFRSLAATGVAVRAYRPFRLARKRWTYWPRDHGRNVVVDDTAYTGGINWGIEWWPRELGGEGWHDVSVGLRGPCVLDFMRVFEMRWEEASRVDCISDHASPPTATDVELIADSPASRSIIVERLCAQVRAARRRVWIENAYCIPPIVLLDALTHAARRGVDVRLLMPAETDLPIIRTITRGEYAEWLRRGLSVSEFQGRVMHSKFAVVDDDWATVGTFNAMTPGIWWANETNVIVHDRRFADELARVFERDTARSIAITHGWTRQRPVYRRLWERFAAGLYRLVERTLMPVRRALRGRSLRRYALPSPASEPASITGE